MTGVARLASIAVTDLSCGYGDAVVLRKVGFSMEAGQTLALTGPNGAGKSTLLKCLAGLLEPLAGRIALDPPLKRRAAARAIGFAGHEPMLSEDLTVSENLLFFARIHGLGDPGAVADRAMADAGLSACRDMRLRECSLGQRQKAGLCRALLADPTLVLLDEPAVGLDDEGRAWLLGRMAGLRRDGAMIVVASHDPSILAEAVATRAVIRDGLMILGG